MIDFVSRQIEKCNEVSVLDSVERTCVGSCRYILLLDKAEPLFLRTQEWVSFVNFPRVTSVACFVVRCLQFFCETCFTLLAYRAGHLRTVHVSQFHLSVYLTPGLVS